MRHLIGQTLATVDCIDVARARGFPARGVTRNTFLITGWRMTQTGGR